MRLPKRRSIAGRTRGPFPQHSRSLELPRLKESSKAAKREPHGVPQTEPSDESTAPTEIRFPVSIWLWVKNRYPKWNPGKSNQGLKPVVPWWFIFHSYPHVSRFAPEISGALHASAEAVDFQAWRHVPYR